MQYALDNHPHIKETASPRRLEAFRFSIEQLLERLSHCLTWGRTNILDDPNTPIVFEGEVYATTFQYLKGLIPDHLPKDGIENLQEYIDYLIQKLPSYRYFGIK